MCGSFWSRPGSPIASAVRCHCWCRIAETSPRGDNQMAAVKRAVRGVLARLHFHPVNGYSSLSLSASRPS